MASEPSHSGEDTDYPAKHKWVPKRLHSRHSTTLTARPRVRAGKERKHEESNNHALCYYFFFFFFFFLFSGCFLCPIVKARTAPNTHLSLQIYIYKKKCLLHFISVFYEFTGNKLRASSVRPPLYYLPSFLSPSLSPCFYPSFHFSLLFNTLHTSPPLPPPQLPSPHPLPVLVTLQPHALKKVGRKIKTIGRERRSDGESR